MLPEQTSIMIEFLKTSNVFDRNLSNGVKAKIWRDITEQCNALPGVCQRSIEQYKRHWYDVKMKVKNKILRRQEALSVPGTETVPDYMELTEEDLYVAKFIRNMEGMHSLVDKVLKSVKTNAPRTPEQTAMLIKLVHLNKHNFKNLDLSHGENIWRSIARTLNQMNGPAKTVDGWKKAYWNWRLQAGDEYEKELERWIKKAPDISATALEIRNEKVGSDSLNENSERLQEDYDASAISAEQEERLVKLVIENKAVMRTGDSDEPLKLQIWKNIADDLNAMPGIKLTPDQWRKRGNLGRKIASHWRRKPKSSIGSDNLGEEKNNCVKTESIATDDLSKIEFEIMNSEDYEDEMDASHSNKNTTKDTDDDPDDVTKTEQDNDDSQALPDDYDSDEEFMCMFAEEEDDEQELKHKRYKYARQQQQQQPRSACHNSTLSATDRDDDDDPPEYKPQNKRFKPSPPIVKSFKFTHRICDAVEKLSDDVKDIKDVLRHTSNSLANMEELMERQCLKQEETNALLKRNNQLLKMLIKYKSGKRKKSSQ